ncbi:hypothetical protein J6W32_01575 [bacterium]|nr:hypothetical protein [bacterium]MBP5783022.1 hypothetical protein [bacterium]MBP5783292.1 hypothetical protein [bacterium]
MAVSLEEALLNSEKPVAPVITSPDADSINSYFVIKRQNNKERFSLDKIKNICN